MMKHGVPGTAPRHSRRRSGWGLVFAPAARGEWSVEVGTRAVRGG